MLISVLAVCSVGMLLLYFALVYFQLKTHSHLFEGESGEDDEAAVLGLGPSLVWLTAITVFISILSEYLVATIEVVLYAV